MTKMQATSILLLGALVTSGCQVNQSNQASTHRDIETGTREHQPYEHNRSPSLESLYHSAEQGDSESQRQLGHRHAQARNFPEAVKWYRLAAKQGDMKAIMVLADMYSDGRGVQQDNAEAVIWYEMAANQGNLRAQYALGTMYVLGQGIPRDYTLAYKWLTLVFAAEGNSNAKEIINAISQAMTRSQIIEANQLITEWMAKQSPK